MAPCADMRGGRFARLEDPERQAARMQLGSSGEADGTGADHGDGKVFDVHADTLGLAVAPRGALGAQDPPAPRQQFSVRKPTSAFMRS